MTSAVDVSEHVGIRALPPSGRAALRGGVVGNWVDNLHVFLPVIALAPALAVLAGPSAAANAAGVVVVAMLLGRPVGGWVFGHVADRLGRTRTTRVAIAGTALCALAIAVVPPHHVIGPATLLVVLLARFAGGVFIAGEYSAAIPLAMEWSQPRRRGLLSGLILSMAPLAQAATALSTAALLVLLGEPTYAAYGWRVLFVAGAAASVAMLLYYRRHVADAQPAPKRDVAATRELLLGPWAGAFWQCFAMMSGLWLLTAVTVLILPSRLRAEAGLSATETALVMACAALAQALAMACAGHLSSVLGRRRLLVTWGLVAAAVSPLLLGQALHARNAAWAALWAAALQVATVSAYGPVAAYLSERFPAELRSRGYGMGYSWSLVLPALYPFYLPWLTRGASHVAVLSLMLLGGSLLMAYAASRGPRRDLAELDAPLDVVAARGGP